MLDTSRLIISISIVVAASLVNRSRSISISILLAASVFTDNRQEDAGKQTVISVIDSWVCNDFKRRSTDHFTLERDSINLSSPPQLYLQGQSTQSHTHTLSLSFSLSLSLSLSLSHTHAHTQTRGIKEQTRDKSSKGKRSATV